MAIPLIGREAFEAPGDVVARPHDNCYWLVAGRLLAGEYPGAADPAEGAARIDALLDAGIRRFVDLTAEHEGPPPYAPLLGARAAARRVPVGYLRHAIPDMGVPLPHRMRATLDAIYEAIGVGEPVYVHCWGGIGRTGTVVGCLLREQGFDAGEALTLIGRKWQAMEKRARHPRSPETVEQIAFLERWPGW